tara:strand:- start:650 stop:841 length:192 start_codon:yes stop_codon:yes gene_type:complete
MPDNVRLFFSYEFSWAMKLQISITASLKSSLAWAISGHQMVSCNRLLSQIDHIKRLFRAKRDQ